MSRSQHAQPQPKLKPAPRSATLFSCGFFRNCTQSTPSPNATPPATSSAPSPPPGPLTTASPPSLPPPISLPPTSTSTSLHHATVNTAPSSSSSSSSSSTSQSFTQWRLPVRQQSPSPPLNNNPLSLGAASAAALLPTPSETYHSAECLFASGNSLQALRLLERAFTPDPSPPGPCPPSVMLGVVAALLDSATARPATKVLLALLLNERNRAEAARAGAAAATLEAVVASGPSGATAERGLAALELLCTVKEGADAVRSNAIAAPALACAVEGMSGRGRECAIGVLAAIYGCGGNGNGNGNGEESGVEVEVPSEVARVVVGAMQGECSARGRRKGAQLLKALQDTGRLDLAWDGIGGS